MAKDSSAGCLMEVFFSGEVLALFYSTLIETDKIPSRTVNELYIPKAKINQPFIKFCGTIDMPFFQY